MSTFSTYQSKLRNGLPSKDDAKWVEELLGKFMNRQTALFMRWLSVKLPTKKEDRERLIIITPLRIILIKKKAFGRSVHRKYRIIDILSVNIDNTSSTTHTYCTLMHCNFEPEISISRCREKLKNNLITKNKIIIHLPKDIDREFLDVLQWSFSVVTRGLPDKFQPKLVIPDLFLNPISDPVGPGQFIIDRYVAYCDAQNKNSGAGIGAMENLIEYVLNSVNTHKFDLKYAFRGSKNKKVDSLQYVCLAQGLSFSNSYNKLIIADVSSADDNNIAILMSLFETNYNIRTLEFRRVSLRTNTMKSLSLSLSCTNGLSQLNELNIIDINIDKNIILSLSSGLSYIKLKILRLTNCYLNKSATINLFNALEKTEQYKHLTHLNISKNQCGKSGTRSIASFINKTISLQVLVVADAQLDGNEFFSKLQSNSNQSNNTLTHLDTITLLDFSGNIIGEKGAVYLSSFIENSRALNFLKLSRCNINVTQLNKIWNSTLKNCSGFPSNKYNTLLKSRALLKPTHADIMLSTNLLCLSIDLSDNALGNKGSEVLCNLLSLRENYTIVSLNLAKNNFNVIDMKNIIKSLKSLACLERLCISDNVKKGISKKSDKDGVIGKALLYLFNHVPTLNELSIKGNESMNCYLDVGLQHFLCNIHTISNLEFLDFSGNKIGTKQFIEFMKSLDRNRSIRLIRCGDNKLTIDMIQSYFELLSNHPTVIDKIPNDFDKSKSKNKNYNKLKAKAADNLKLNKTQFEIDREMMSSLSREMRLEKELRRACGKQFGISLGRIRGTVRYPDYKSRIPQILVKLKNLLKTKNGFNTVGIFRIQPDGNEFPIVKNALNINNFEHRINDINCIANAIKVWYRDLPVKVLNPISKEKIAKCSTQQEVLDIISNETILIEPYKSLFEWLLDLSVEVILNVSINRMDAKNMAVVLCPNLYDTPNNQDALSFSPLLLRFTEFAIRSRIDYRKKIPIKEINDSFAIQAGLTPGIASQKELEQRMLDNMNDDDDDDDIKPPINKLKSISEGDGFGAGALYSGSRFRGASIQQDDQKNNMKVRGARGLPQFVNNVDDNKDNQIPPPAFAAAAAAAPAGSDYNNDIQSFNDISASQPSHHANLSVAIEPGKVKNVAARLAIDPTAMLPGRSPPKRLNKLANAAPKQLDNSAAVSKPSGPQRKKKKKKKKKKLLLADMVDNYDDASAKPPPPPPNDPPRKVSRHVPMESKVLGGFVQPGLSLLAAHSANASVSDFDPSGGKKKRGSKVKHKKQDTESDDELIPALQHLTDDNVAASGNNKISGALAMDGDGNNDDDDDDDDLDYEYEEKTFSFDTKPMGFQIEAENGKIRVRSVRQLSIAGSYGVQIKWEIVAVNAFRDWSSMLGILESSLGPFKITFKVAVPILSRSISIDHPIIPPPPAANDDPPYIPPIPSIPSNKSNSKDKSNKLLAMSITQPIVPPPAAAIVNQPPPVPSVPSISNMPVPQSSDNNDMKADEYNKMNKMNRNKIDMHRNSSAIAKDVLNEYQNKNKSVKTNVTIFSSSSSIQQSEYLRLEKEIALQQNKNDQLIETLQVIRLKGEMERIELLNSKKIQTENIQLKKKLNSKIKPLKLQVKNLNKQIQTQRQLMYQYANLLRRHKIPIPELQASLAENETSSDESDDDSDDDDDSSSDQ